MMIWAPEQNAYFTLGSLAAATASAPAGGPSVEAAIRAIVAVAKSTPAPPGLKAALTRDSDFLTLLGRKPTDGSAPVSAGTTGGAQGAAAADAAAKAAGRLPPPPRKQPEEQRADAAATAEVESPPPATAAATAAAAAAAEEAKDDGAASEAGLSIIHTTILLSLISIVLRRSQPIKSRHAFISLGRASS